jgi:hypothetical protein
MMAKSASIPQDVAVDEVKPDLKAQLAEYVAQQPASRQALHKWMSWLTIVSLAIPAGLFIRAIYLSVVWKQIDARRIPVAWLTFVASATLPFFLTGLHAVLLRAFPPLPQIGSKFVTGRDAVWSGAGMMVVLLVVGAFWGFVAYAVWTFDLDMLEPLMRVLGIVIGVGAAISVAFSLLRQIRRSR